MLPFSYIYQGIIVPAAVTIPMGIGLYRYRYANSALRAVLFYLVVAGIINGVAASFAFMHKNNLPLLHIYTMLELLLLIRFCHQAISSPPVRKWARLVAFLFPLLCIVNFSFFQSIYTFNSYTRPLEAIILVTFCMIYLSQQPVNETGGRWADQPETWIVIGLLLYFSSALFQFAFSNIVSSKAAFGTKMLIWNIHASLVLVMYLLFSAGFVKCKR